MKNGNITLRTARGILATCAMTAAIALPTGGAWAEGLPPLGPVPVPRPSTLATYIAPANEAAAIQLGKALFWEMQAGGDGQQACASCHFQAGGDTRSRNQVNPHGNSLFDLARGLTGPVTGPNVQLVFNPLVLGIRPSTSHFPIISDDVVGSAGLPKTSFLQCNAPGNPLFPSDLGTLIADTIFNVNGTNVRQVTGRNTPSVINAVYNFRQFWDGRAREIFNGKNPAGLGDPSAQVWSADAFGTLTPVTVAIDNASLASQAVGPPNNGVEMSFSGRIFPNLARKLLNPTVVPLGQQNVRGDDSRLGVLANPGLGGPNMGFGLNTTYMAMVQAAFQPQWWNSIQCVDANMNLVADFYPCANSFTMMEANFSLFWGLAIQMYESTLLANDTRADRFAAGIRNTLTEPTRSLNAQEQRGLTLFTGNGRCIQCHKGAELTTASVSQVTTVIAPEVFNPTKGFENDAVRPVAEDNGIDAFLDNPPAEPLHINAGRFKTPHLRNVELNGPYFHNGEMATLRQVVDFYNRGGDFLLAGATNSQIRPLGLSVAQRTDLVAFMLALTDARVKNESAPFDHPSLVLHNGHNPDGSDNNYFLPAVGGPGRALQVPPLPPIVPFLNVNHQNP